MISSALSSIFFLHVLTLQVFAADLVSKHSFFAPLDEDQNVKLFWNVSTAKKEITFTVEAKTTGWIGFGISSGQGKMTGADIVIGWVKDGKPYFKDRHADGYTVPKKDSQQDYELISLTEDNGKTTMTFKRKFDTCDSQDNKIEPGTTKVIYAYHPNDPSSEDAIPQHSQSNRGARSLSLLNSAKKRPTLPADTKFFDIRLNKTAIPKEETTYRCGTFEVPKVNGTHHIIKFEPVIQPGNEGVVHHMLLYECSDDFPEHHLNYTGECYVPNMPTAIKNCAGLSPIAAWGIGGKAFYYPEHAGFPIGKSDSPKVVLIEVHYDNPRNVEGMIDSSGLRFYYTKQLRKYDAAIVQIGPNLGRSMTIPPGQKDFEMSGFCSADCTKEAYKGSKLPGGGINVFAELFHTHLAGRKIYLRHIRDGIELPEIARDDYYDFNFQEYLTLNKEVNIAPGDSLINVCIYDTRERSLGTYGSFGTRDEMCFSFLMYYPKMNLTKCVSDNQPAWQKWDDEYIKKDYRLLGRPSFWTETVSNGLRDAYRGSDLAVASCMGRAGQLLPGLGGKLVKKPVIKTPYKSEPSCVDPTPESMGNSVVPEYLVLMITFVYSAVFTP